MSRCYVANTRSVLGIDWAGQSQDGLTHCLGFLLNFTDWLVWSMFLPHHFTSCGSIIYFNIWEVMFASLFHIRLRKSVSIFFSRWISPSFYLIFSKTGTWTFSTLSANPGLFREPLSGTGVENHGFSELKETSRSTCHRLLEDSCVTFVPFLQVHLQLEENLPPVQKLVLGNY